MPAANKADIIPYIKTSKFPSNNAGSMTPFLMVCVTPPPAKKAPKNSKIAATKIACLMVKTLLPTDVPIALATSFAPTP